MSRLFFLVILLSDLSGYSVSGNVFDSETDQPLGNVNVTIIGSEIGTTTNNQGKFQLNDINAGDQSISFSLIGYKIFSISLSYGASDQALKISLEKEPLQWKAVNVMGLIPSKHSPEVTEIVSSDKIMNTDQEIGRASCRERV